MYHLAVGSCSQYRTLVRAFLSSITVHNIEHITALMSGKWPSSEALESV